jgi:hypothetical protein
MVRADRIIGFCQQSILDSGKRHQDGTIRATSAGPVNSNFNLQHATMESFLVCQDDVSLWKTTKPGSRDMYNSSTQCRFKLQSAYSNWVHEILNGVWDKKLWNGFQVSFMFNHIPGNFNRKCLVMEEKIDRVYRILVPHVERSPRSPAGSRRLPILIAFPDYPQQRIKSADLLDVTINDGLHFHGVVLVHTESRLKIGLDIHMKDHADRYVREGDRLRRIYIQPIDDSTAKTAVGYGFKALEWRIPDTDRIFIRPRALSELPVGKRRQEQSSLVKARQPARCKRQKGVVIAPRTPPIHRF